MSDFIMELVARFRTDDEGQAMVEYGLILALVSVVAVIALAAIGDGVNSAFNTVVSNLP